MLINSPNISGSLTVTGNSIISGSLNVLGSITGAITGSATTASYVEYNNVANKPALVSGSSQIIYSGLTGIPSGIVSGSSQITYSGLSGIPSGIVSGSSQVSFNGIVDKPTLVSGSSQITYSGLTGIPSGIVSGSAQITGFGIFATTGSNQFNGNQAITGSLTTTGTIVAQTLNVQQVTSSIVFSSGSNIFGNSVSNTQQFTGSLQVSGSSHYLLGSVGVGVTSPVAELQVGKASDVTIAMSNSNSITSGVRGNITWYNSSNSTVANIRATAVTDNVGTQLEFYTRPAAGSLTQRLTLDSSGNLGLGVTPSAWGSQAKAMQLGTGAAISGIGSDTHVSNGIFYDGANWKYLYSGSGVSTYYQTVGAHIWFNAPSGAAAGNNVSLSQAMTLNASGRLLLGTTDDNGARLQVSGVGTFTGSSTVSSVSINNSNASGFSLLSLTNTGASGRSYDLGVGGNTSGQNGNFYIFDNNAGATRLTIASSGAATFSNALQVAGQQAATNYGGTGLNFDFTSGNIGRIASVKTTSGGSQLQFFVYNTSGSDVNALQIASTGAATFSSSVGIGTTPSYRLHVVTDAVAGRQNMSNISRTTANWVRFTNPQYSADASMGLILRVFPDSDLRQGAGIIASGGSNNACTNLDLFVTTSPDGLGGTSYSALNINGFSGAATFSSTLTTGGDISVSNAIRYKVSGTEYGVSFANAGAFGIEAYQGTYFFIGTGSGASATERLRITNGGNVGINTTTVASGYRMEVVGDVLLSTTSGNRSLVLTTTNANAALNTLAGSGLELASDGSNRNLAFRTGTTTAMYINSSANVGIGTTSPTNRVHIDSVDDNAYALRVQGNTNNAANVWTGIGIAGEAANTKAAILFQDIGVSFSRGKLLFCLNNAQDQSIATPSNAVMTLTNDGNVGIGTTSPTKRLQVEASVAGEVTNIKNTRNNSIGDYGLVTELGTNDNNTNNYHYIAATGGADRMYIYGNGNIVNTNGSYGTLSDISLKENIVDATPKLADLLQLKVRNFNLIGSEEKQIGFIAQEFEEIFPKMVDMDGKNGMKTIKTSVLVPMLVKAIQELKSELDATKTEIQLLKQQ